MNLRAHQPGARRQLRGWNRLLRLAAAAGLAEQAGHAAATQGPQSGNPHAGLQGAGAALRVRPLGSGSNNLAARALRMHKIQQKISGCY